MRKVDTVHTFIKLADYYSISMKSSTLISRRVSERIETIVQEFASYRMELTFKWKKSCEDHALIEELRALNRSRVI